MGRGGGLMDDTLAILDVHTDVEADNLPQVGL